MFGENYFHPRYFQWMLVEAIVYEHTKRFNNVCWFKNIHSWSFIEINKFSDFPDVSAKPDVEFKFMEKSFQNCTRIFFTVAFKLQVSFWCKLLKHCIKKIKIISSWIENFMGISKMLFPGIYSFLWKKKKCWNFHQPHNSLASDLKLQRKKRKKSTILVPTNADPANKTPAIFLPSSFNY